MIFQKDGVFCLETERTGLYIAPRGPLAEQLHYGQKIQPSAPALRQPLAVAYGTDVIYDKSFDPALSLLHLGLEVSPTEKGDFRRGALALTLANGSPVCDLRFAGGEVLPAPPEVPGLPTAREAGECLVLRFESGEGMAAELFYIPLDDCDVIVRQTRLTNRTGGPVTIRRAMSYQLDLPRQDLELTTLTGAWAREFEPCTAPVRRGLTEFGSVSGTSSHYCNPFFALSAPGTNEHTGEIYGFNLLYSGSHAASVEADSYGFTRVMAGIQPEGFCWTLAEGGSFVTPQAALTFSAEGRNGLHIQEDHFLAEIIDPVTGEQLPLGERGELVITTLTKEGIPLIRYRTRDITSLSHTPCSCGRTFAKLHRFTGRTDDMLIIRGVNVYPSQIESILLETEGVSPHYQIIVTREGALDNVEVQVEVSGSNFSDTIKDLQRRENAIQKTIKEFLGITSKVRLVEPRTIQRSEGKAVRVLDKRAKADA